MTIKKLKRSSKQENFNYRQVIFDQYNYVSPLGQPSENIL